MTTPTERFLIGYDAFPFGGAETKVPDTPEWRGWWTRMREGLNPPPNNSKLLYRTGGTTRPIHAPYKPYLSGSDAAINTVLRWL
jgi:hypothetical protein